LSITLAGQGSESVARVTQIAELSKIDAMIIEEQRNIAREHFNEMWDSAVAEGIDIDIIAEELITGALLELAGKNGSEATQRLITALGEREASGAFYPNRILQ